MILRGWHIDGFGIFQDWQSETLEPGLTVILGPNEAGKSTLLAFVRGVLFGFPDKRSKHREPLYEPQRGGRPGGRLTVEHEGRRYTVERRAGSRTAAPTILDADGQAVPEGELTRLLGGADRTLFRNVFGFSLSELQEPASLTEESVRDRIFSGAIAGAGRSARKAADDLEKAATVLYRPDGRHKTNRVAELYARLSEIDAGLQEARDAARDYPAKLQAEQAAAEEVERVKAARDELDRRKARLDGLIKLRPVWDAREAALAELEQAGAGPFERAQEVAPPPDLAELQRRADALGRSAELQRKHLKEAEDLRIALDGQGERIERALAALGADWTVERVDAFALPIPTREEIRAWHDALEAERAGVNKADGKVEEARRRVEEAREKHDGLARELEAFERPPADMETLQARQKALATLRGTLAEFARQQQAAENARNLTDERGKRVQDLRAQRPGPHGYAAAALTLLLGGAVAAYAAGAVAPALGVGVAAAVLLIAAALAWSTRRRRHGVDGRIAQAEADRSAAEQEAARQDAEADRLEVALREQAAAADFDGLPGEADVNSAAWQLDRDMERRCAIDAKAQDVANAKTDQDRRKTELETEREALQAAQQARDDKLEAWAAYKRERGFPEPLTPEGVREFAGEVEGCQKSLREKRDHEARLAKLHEEIAAWEDEARAVLQARGAVGEDTGAALVDRFAAAADAIAAERDAYRRVREAEQAIAREAGHDAARADDLRRTLHAGAAEDWEREKAELEEKLESFDSAHDAALRAQHEAERDRKELETSDRIAELELERSALAEEIAQAVRQWQVYTAAQTLIEDTLEKFERERQPAVFANASERLGRITGGRYRQIVQNSDGEGFTVIDRDDRRIAPIDLSRGTREQLYLAVRLGLIEEFVQRGTSLPLVMDEILVNFDPDRMAGVAAELGSFAERHQVLLFTCHPEIAERVRTNAGAKVLPIAKV